MKQAGCDGARLSHTRMMEFNAPGLQNFETSTLSVSPGRVQTGTRLKSVRDKYQVRCRTSQRILEGESSKRFIAQA